MWRRELSLLQGSHRSRKRLTRRSKTCLVCIIMAKTMAKARIKAQPNPKKAKLKWAIHLLFMDVQYLLFSLHFTPLLVSLVGHLRKLQRAPTPERSMTILTRPVSPFVALLCVGDGAVSPSDTWWRHFPAVSLILFAFLLQLLSWSQRTGASFWMHSSRFCHEWKKDTFKM